MISCFALSKIKNINDDLPDMFKNPALEKKKIMEF
jgi:hypothetical protein